MNKQLFLEEIYALIKDEKNIIANLANISAYLNEILSNINWVGFYLLEDNELILGPFQGRVACVRIPIGKGVCGTAAYQRTTICVDDVHQFQGHIACDSHSRSEIVIPIIKEQQLLGVLDVDSPSYNRFSQKDQIFLEKVVELMVEYLF
ncbi:MAG: GAF domain-containing protein [Coprobacillus sp.]|nr:GAF domain-containing protein [Coprobacillus sp.]